MEDNRKELFNSVLDSYEEKINDLLNDMKNELDDLDFYG